VLLDDLVEKGFLLPLHGVYSKQLSIYRPIAQQLIDRIFVFSSQLLPAALQAYPNGQVILPQVITKFLARTGFKKQSVRHFETPEIIAKK